MSRAVSALLASFLLLASSSPASAGWTRISSPHFVFIGDASERTIRNVAERVELFREAMGRLFSEEAVGSPTPTVVIVFQDDRSLTPFKPRFQGKPIAIAGYFSTGDGPNYISLNAEQDTVAFGVVFHEYAHALLANAVGPAPLWVNEGLAGFYQTFESQNGGKTIVVGVPIPDHLRLLQSTPLMPLEELIAIDNNSSMYNEGDRRTLFYAQSWALVHCLSFSSPQRNEQLKQYLAHIRAGTPSGEAFHQAFGDAAVLQRELAEYVRRVALNSLRLNFDERLVRSGTSRAEVIPDSEAAGYLGDVMARVDVDAARAYLRKVVDTNADAGRATGALGMLEMRAGNFAEAIGLLERAATLSPDAASVQSAYGRALVRSADGQRPDSDALLARAREALRRAHQLEPDDVATAADLADVEMDMPGGASRATALLQRTVTLAPGREDLRLMLADALTLEGNYDAAALYLGALVGRGSTADIREKARGGLARLATARRASEPAADGVSADRAPRVTANSSPPEAPRPSLPQGASVPVFRSVKAGETRVFGTFTSVGCEGGHLVIEIETDVGPVQMVTDTLGDVEFRAYRPDAPRGVACGEQRPAYPVLATFLEPPDGASMAAPNRAVAIELLPEGYLPR